MNPQVLKLASPFLTKCKRGTVAVLGNICVTNKIARITDFETELQFVLDKPDGLYDLVNGELFLMSEDTSDFPLPALTGHTCTNQGMVLAPDTTPSTKDIANLAASRANDELRPVMNGIHFTRQQIEATDAHILKILPVNSDETCATKNLDFITPMPQVLISAFNNTSAPVAIKQFADDKNNPAINFERFNLQYEFDNFTIVTRQIEGRYPDTKSIFPHIDNIKHFISFSSDLVTEFVKFSKGIQNSSGLIIFRNGVPEMQNIDLNLAKTWPAVDTVKPPKQDSHTLLMPITIHADNENEFGFSIYNLERLIKGFKGNIIIGSQNDPNRAMLVWLQPSKQSKPSRKPAPKRPVTTHSFTGPRFHNVLNLVMDKRTDGAICEAPSPAIAAQIAAILNNPAAFSHSPQEPAPVPKPEPVPTVPQTTTRPAKPNPHIKLLWSSAS